MRVGARTLRLASERLANGRGEFRRQRSLDADQGHLGIAALEPDLDAVCRVRIDYDPVTLRNAAYRGQAVGVAALAGNESGLGQRPCMRGARKIELALLREIAPEPTYHFGIASDQIEHEALEIRGLGAGHRWARCGNHLACRTDPIMSGPEELVEHVVLVGREDQTAERQAHAAGRAPGEDVAELAARHREIDHVALVARCCEIALEIIDDLRRDARPIDRIDRTEAMAFFER